MVREQSTRRSDELFDELYDEYIRKLERGDQSDDISLNEDIDYELHYTRSHRERFRAIWDDLPQEQDQSILDIGPTPFTFILNETYESISTIDYTDLKKPQCEEDGICHVTHDLSEGTVPFEDKEFDYIILHGVLEHLITAPEPLFEDMRRVLNPDGELILGTPNFATLLNRMTLLFGRNPQGGLEREHVHGIGHVREYTMDELQHHLLEAGFEVKKSEHRHYRPFLNRVKRAVSESAIGNLPTPIDYIAAIGYFGLTAGIPALRYHLYVIGKKTQS